MKKKIVLVLLVLLFSGLAISQDTYSKIAIAAHNHDHIEVVNSFGIPLDHAQLNGNQLSFFVNQQERQLLDDAGVAYEMLIPDFSIYYQQLLVNDAANTESMSRNEYVGGGFGLGSMGGFYTFAEIEGKLDEMFMNYPNLITEKVSIGTTFEGRPIWMVKISDNPTIDEPEPVAYFDAMHHAREPLSMAVTLNYMFWLLENYGIDDRVTYLINNRELYFVPLVNPDGYEYNRQIEPDGGGLWRKNRKVNIGSSCIGVDINRNYSESFAFDNFCSTPDPCSGIYRGDFAFSEAETIAVRDFIDQINPAAGFTSHSTVGVHIMPYTLEGNFTDFSLYSEWGSDFLDENNYAYGAAIDLIGYSACGTTDQYLYSEGVYAWTPEIGGQGFWPPPSTIFDLVGENVLPMFFKSWIAGGYVDVQSHQIQGNPIPGETLSLVVEAKNIGLEEATNVSIAVTSNNPAITISESQDYGPLDARTRNDNSGNPFMIDIPPSFSEDFFTLTMSTFQEGVINDSLEIQVFVSNKQVLFFDDAETGPGEWTAAGNNLNWGVVDDDAYSGSFSFGDSNGSSFQSSTDNSFTLNTTLDFSTTVTPVLSFLTKHSFAFQDRVDLEISTDGGTSWELLDSFSGNQSWIQYQKNLTDYNGFDNINLRFVLSTNEFTQTDGFYFDDFEVANYDSVLNTVDITKTEVICYPNPTKGVVNILFPKGLSQLWEVTVYDIQGRAILTTKLENEVNAFLDLGSFESGIYLVRIVNGKGIKTIQKILKN